MTGPRVGRESDEYRSVCVYEPEPYAPQCEKRATWHVRVEDKAYGEVALSSCDDHVGLARASGRLVQEHTFDGCCGFPGSLWIIELNVCVLDDSGVPGLVQTKQLEMTQ